MDRSARAAALVEAALRLGDAPDATGLTAFCREVAGLLGLAGVCLFLEPPAGDEPLAAALSEGARREYRWPPSALPGEPRPARTAPRIPIEHGGEPVAELVMLTGSPGAARAAQAAMPAEVVALLGPVLDLCRTEARRGAALDRARYLAERIAVARRVALIERDRERQELERDLHDGAQHHLVALQMAVGLVEVRLDAGDTGAARAALARLRSGIALAERSLLELAAGNCPPVLLEEGVAAALSAELLPGGPAGGEEATAVHPLGVSFRVEGEPRRFPLVAETAVFFTCLEAVNNARKHAPGAPVGVVLRAGRDGLAFRVADEGPGLTQRTLDTAFGLNNMRARIEAVGGKLEVRTVLGGGTTVEGFIPG
jgi:signal transduction histidine kinase